MTPEEICRHYSQASDKRKDIQILADLNTTDKASIRAVLIDGGLLPADPPKRAGRPRTAKAPAPAPAEDVSAQAAAAAAPPPETSVYQRVDTILAALPADAGRATRIRAYNLVMGLLVDAIRDRLGVEPESKEGSV